MGRVSLITDEMAAGDPVLQALFQGTLELGGRVPNSSRTYAHLPLIAVWQAALTAALQREGGGGRLPGRLKEMIVLKTSMLNACDYCVGHNTVLGKATGLTQQEIDDLGGDFENSTVLSPAEKALLRWSAAVTLNQAQRDQAAFADLKAHFGEAEIVEITWLSAMFCMLNRVHDALQIDEEPMSDRKRIASSKIVSVEQICRHVTRAVGAISEEKADAPAKKAKIPA